MRNLVFTHARPKNDVAGNVKGHPNRKVRMALLGVVRPSSKDWIGCNPVFTYPTWLPTTETKLTQRPGCPPRLWVKPSLGLLI
jgi:hypothetical protein